jgi:integrase
MIERLTPKTETQAPNTETKKPSTRAKANKRHCTEELVQRLPLATKEELYVIYRDEKQDGLSVLCTQSTRTYRATFRLDGKQVTKKIGRVGIMKLEDARKRVISYLSQANDDIDPRKPKPSQLTFGHVATEFIEQYCKTNMRAWDQVENLLTNNCEALWSKPIDKVTKRSIRDVTDPIANKDGHHAKARALYAHIRSMLAWAHEAEYVKTNVLYGAKDPGYEQTVRDIVYSDDEIKLFWKAADQLEDVYESAYVKLLILLASRKTALAAMKWCDLDNRDDPKVWVTPFEFTKSKKKQKKRTQSGKKRVYVTPLPALAQRILKGLPKGNSPEARVFPTLTLIKSKAGRYEFNHWYLLHRMLDKGSPHIIPHACRHTCATWLESKDHSEFEVGLVLNHSSSSITGDYKHGNTRGFVSKLKLDLLSEWATHVESLITPQGVALLR